MTDDNRAGHAGSKPTQCLARQQRSRRPRAQVAAGDAGASKGRTQGLHDRSRAYRDDRGRYAERLLPSRRLARLDRRRCRAGASADRAAGAPAAGAARRRPADRLGQLGQSAGPPKSQPGAAARLQSDGCRHRSRRPSARDWRARCWRRTAGQRRSSTSSRRAKSDIRVDKHRMSGFWDTPLDSILRNLGVTTLLFGGVNADQCVLHTLADANFLGYDTLMVGDCTATTSPPSAGRRPSITSSRSSASS